MNSSRNLTIPVGVFVSLVSLRASALPVTIVVSSTADAVTGCATAGMPQVGTPGCTLRDAITYSNANPPAAPDQNTIAFDIPGGGVQTIDVLSDLPPITAAVIVDGFSQPGASPNTLAVGSDAVLNVEVHGGSAVQRILVITGGAGSAVRGLVLRGHAGRPAAASALELDSCCNQVVGNFLGLDSSGTSAGACDGGAVAASDGNQIGGPAPADRNVFGGSCLSEDLVLLGDFNTIQGNYIGTTAGGTAATGLGDVNGVGVAGNSNHVVANVISGELIGVWIEGNQNVVSGNNIGTDASGTSPIPNALGVDCLTGSNNTIGAAAGSDPLLGALFQGNRIAYNGNAGVEISWDQPLDTFSNAILSNEIFANSGLGIDLTASAYPYYGVTPNDPGDTDTGPNELQNFPVLLLASGIMHTNVSGTLNSLPLTKYRIQFFSNTACDPSGYGEGETLVDEKAVNTDGSGNVSFTDAIFPRVPPGQFLTATATDPAGNTSEFSQCIQVSAVGPPPPPPYVTVTRFLTEGPVRVPPGVPVEFLFGVEAKREARESAAGGVSVFDDAGHSCETTLIRSGVGACALTFDKRGRYVVRARYEGQGDFLTSLSDRLVVHVRAGAEN